MTARGFAPAGRCPRVSSRFCGVVTLLLLLGPLSGDVFAQGEDSKIGVEEIVTLHRAGFSDADLAKAIKKHGVPSLSASEVEKLKEQGIGKVTLALLQRGPKLSPTRKKLSVDDVVLLVKAGVSEAEIIKQIEGSQSRFDLSPDAIVDLALKGIPAAVIKKMRASSTAGKKAQAKQESVTLKDLRDMARAGWTSDQLLKRIKERKARFALKVDDLIELTRDGVPEPVITYIWENRLKKEEQVATKPTEAPPAKANEADDLLIHVEPTGGFSLTMPRGWAVHRENRGANSLLSFTEKVVAKTGELTDGEIQIFQIRAGDPKRLTQPNLGPIAENFLNRLVISYRKKGMELAYMARGTGMISARPAVRYAVSSTTSDGDTREGELWVTWKERPRLRPRLRASCGAPQQPPRPTLPLPPFVHHRGRTRTPRSGRRRSGDPHRALRDVARRRGPSRLRALPSAAAGGRGHREGAHGLSEHGRSPQQAGDRDRSRRRERRGRRGDPDGRRRPRRPQGDDPAPLRAPGRRFPAQALIPRLPAPRLCGEPTPTATIPTTRRRTRRTPPCRGSPPFDAFGAPTPTNRDETLTEGRPPEP